MVRSSLAGAPIDTQNLRDRYAAAVAAEVHSQAGMENRDEGEYEKERAAGEDADKEGK